VLDPENETGSLEDFMFRRYSPVQGRWISPDPAGMGAANPASPQSWNRYAYVSNGPLNAVDPSGLWRSDVFGTGKNGDAFRDVGGAWFAAQIQEFKVEAGLDSPLQQGERVYQAQVDCAFNPGSCPKGVPGTPGGPVLVPGGAIYGSYSNKYETVSNILLGTVSASSVPQEYWDAYANAATHLVWQWWDEHSYYRSGLTEEDARANELAYRVGMDTMNIFTPCDGLQVGSILLGAEATPWLGETIGKVAYFLGNAGALASLGCD
jgi:RHS repeat-associated protein